MGEWPGLCTEPGWKDLLLIQPVVCVDSFVRVALGLDSQVGPFPKWGVSRGFTQALRGTCASCWSVEAPESGPRAWSMAWDSEAGDQAWRPGAGSPLRGKVA